MTATETYDKMTNFSLDEFDLDLATLTDADLDILVDKLFNYWFDIRKTLDEQMIVNDRFYPNFFIYEAREAEAKAKFLHAKAFKMMRNWDKMKRLDNNLLK